MSDTNTPITQDDLNAAHRVLSSPTARAKIFNEVDKMDIKKPVHWKRRSTASYYRERFGLEFKETIDKMLADERKEDVLYSYNVYCAPDYGMTPNTLYTRLYQSMKYMLDYMDTPDHKYEDAMSKIELSRKKGVGILLSFMPDVKLGKPFLPETVKRADESASWKQELIDWMNTPHEIGERKIVDKLTLTESEVNDWTIRLNNSESYTAVVTSNAIKVMCVPPED
jgi:hypothetical protein